MKKWRKNVKSIFLIWNNDESIVTNCGDKRRDVVIVSSGHYQNMIIQHLLDETTYNQLDSCVDSKIQSDLLQFLIKYVLQNLIGNFLMISAFYGLPKIHKSMVIKSAIITQNSKNIGIFEPNDLKLRPIVGGGPKFLTRKRVN